MQLNRDPSRIPAMHPLPMEVSGGSKGGQKVSRLFGPAVITLPAVADRQTSAPVCLATNRLPIGFIVGPIGAPGPTLFDLVSKLL